MESLSTCLSYRPYMKLSCFVLAVLCPILACAQLTHTATLDSPALDTSSKLDYYVEKVFSPLSLLQDTAEVTYAHLQDSPKEWGEGWHGLWRRGVDNVGYDALRNTFMFGLNGVSGGDPRYFRMGDGNFFVRAGHAITQPLVGHADGGRKVLPWVRFVSTFGVAFLSNTWYPERISDTRHALVRGVFTLGTDSTKSFAYEFWPDVKKKLFHHKNSSPASAAAVKTP
jgi:hypothetical protein